MVNLGRQLGVAQARQGGFSAHILPQSIRYDGFEPIIAYATPSGFQVTGTYQSVSIPTLAAGQILSGAGPFGETAAGGVNLGETNLYNITLGNASPGITDFTLEWWFKVVSVLSGSQFNMASLFGASINSAGFLRFGTTNAPFLLQSISTNNNGIFTYTLTWSAAVTNFTAEDITVTNGTLLTFTANSSTVYTIVVQGGESLPVGSAPGVNVTGPYNFANQNADQIFFEHQILGGGGSRTTQATLPLSAWRHAAIVRSGVNHRSYLNGALLANVIASQNYGSNEPINFSNASVNGGVATNLNMGQLRYTKAAIYSGDTIPVPTAPFFVPT